MRKEKWLTKEEVLKIPELLKLKTQQEVANELGVHRGTIKNWVYKLRKAGCKIELKRGRKEMNLKA